MVRDGRDRICYECSPRTMANIAYLEQRFALRAGLRWQHSGRVSNDQALPGRPCMDRVLRDNVQLFRAAAAGSDV